MLNIKILIILQLFLFIQVNSTIAEEIDTELMDKEYVKCAAPFEGKIKIEADKCAAISPSLELSGIHKGKCCKLAMSYDNLLQYQKMYNENWKKMAIKQLGLDEDVTEEEIKSKYLIPQDIEFCFLIVDSIKDLMLYQLSTEADNKEVKYDCGTGEKTFAAKNYHPTDEDALLDKDSIDCSLEYTEKNCNKKSMKLSSDDSQCCWCEKIMLQSENIEEEKMKECNSIRISKMKELLQRQLVNDQKKGKKIEYKCDCYNRKGNNSKFSYNTVNGEIKIE